MKQHNTLKIILILCGLFIAFSASAHPYDKPLTFRKHLTDDGRVIYSNIPKSCFSKGLLTCQNLHPVYEKSVSMKSESKTKTKKTEQVKVKLKTPQVGQVKTNPEIPQTEPEKMTKLVESGICDQPEDPAYKRTKEERERFMKIHGCVQEGDRSPETRKTEQVKTNSEAPQTEPEKMTKPSEIGICDQPEDPADKRTKEERERFLKIHGCVQEGDR
jgi:hypothetical protein